MNNTKTYKFHASGLHCNSCVLVTESELQDLPYVKKAKTSLRDHSITVTGDFGERTPEAVAADLTKVVEKHGYALSMETKSVNRNWAEFKIAIPIAIAFGAAFALLQKIGLIDSIGAGTVSYGSVFLIGIIASLSTCMAVVGGLLLSMSATFARGGDKLRPQIMFHAGRLVSFVIFGAVIGALGSAFALNASATVVLGILIGLVMLILGVNLLDIFHFTKKLQPSMPKFLSKHALGISKMNHTLTPLLVGVATFFLPCGFTQSMQIYSLGTGSWQAGALTMLVYALGTLPVLALISYGSFSFKDSPKAGVFFKTAGLIVIMFAVINIVNSLAVAGLIPPIFNF